MSSHESGFQDFGLAAPILRAVRKAGYTKPTPVQEKAIPLGLEGRDLLVQARTGSGKTAAFMLPALQHISTQLRRRNRQPLVLILSPTRELAAQISEAAREMGLYLEGLQIATLVGGMSYRVQQRMLSRRVDIVVATPGRLLDQMRSGNLDLSRIETLVLDEADRMLDMGFIEDITTVVEQLPKNRQTFLFSATLDPRIARLAGNMLKDPVQLRIGSDTPQHANIQQSLYYANNAGHKRQLLKHLLNDDKIHQAIIFTATKRGADELARELVSEGIRAGALHGDMNQFQRNRTLRELQQERLRILVATDVAARGLDVSTLTHAFNYDLPRQPDDYVHRIGRTGRAGRKGIAITLAEQTESHLVNRIEKNLGHKIQTAEIEGLEPTPMRKKASRPRRLARPGALRNNYGDAHAKRPSRSRAPGAGRKSRPAKRSGQRSRV